MHHGQKSFEVTAPRSRFYHGGFGRLFPDLKPWEPAGASSGTALETAMMEIAQTRMTEAAPGDTESDVSIPSGYTYFGQFVDHDITFDVTPLSEAEVDPNRLHNFRTPRLDLDSLYGQGPAAQPYLYEKGGRFRVGKAVGADFADLPRLESNGSPTTALIGDPRNDENAIVAQVHLAFLLSHNRLVGAAENQVGPNAAFEAARKTLRWLYQWIVWHDFVRRICDPAIHAHAIANKQVPGFSRWEAGYKDFYDWKNSPFMPVEFSAAAYRFGHSLVRSGYQTNFTHGVGRFVATFSDTSENLRGGRGLDIKRVLQWDWFLQMTSSRGPQFPQLARKFDTKLARALRFLPGSDDAPGDETKLVSVLAARNLVRGVRLNLPGGSDVAKALGLQPALEPEEPDALFYYILKEAELGGGQHLGKVGSVIVAATFAGLLLGDPLSFFNIEPGWTPDNDPLLSSLNAGDALTVDGIDEAKSEGLSEADAALPQNAWRLASIIRLAELPVDIDRFPPAAAAAGTD